MRARFDGESNDPKTQSVPFVPLLVELGNQSSRPVRVQMRDISLVNERGKRFHPLAIVMGRGPSVAPAVLTRTLRDVNSNSPNGPDRSGFLAPRELNTVHAGPTTVIYPNGALWGNRVAHVVDGQRLTTVSLPAMDAITLPEGSLEPGDRSQGYIYFSHRAKRSGRVRLIWDARADDGDQIAMLSLNASLVVK